MPKIQVKMFFKVVHKLTELGAKKYICTGKNSDNNEFITIANNQGPSS
jgi:hypothetical protein